MPDDDAIVEQFAPQRRHALAVLGGLVVAGHRRSAGALDRTTVAARGRVAARSWAACSSGRALRPARRCWSSGSDLVLRNMLSTIDIPLAAIDEVVVRQVLAVTRRRQALRLPGDRPDRCARR